MLWLSRRLWRSGLGGQIGTAIVCLSAGLVMGTVGSLVLSDPASTSVGEAFLPVIVIALVATTVMVAIVAGHAVAVRAAELELLGAAGATRSQTAFLVLLDASTAGALAGAAGSLVAAVLVSPADAFLSGAGLSAGGTGTASAASWHLLVVPLTAVTIGAVCLMGSLGAALAVSRPTRSRPTRRWLTRRTGRTVVGALMAGALVLQASRARDDGLGAAQWGFSTMGLTVVVAILLTPALLRLAGSGLAVLTARRGPEPVLIAAGEARTTRQSAAVLAPLVAVVLALVLTGIGDTSVAANRAGLSEGLSGSDVVTDAGRPLSTAQVVSATGQQPFAMVVGRTRATWLAEGDGPLEFPVGAVDPAALRATWRGAVDGDLTDFAPSGTVVVARADALSFAVGSVLSFATAEGVMRLRVVATVAASGPWGMFFSPADAASLMAPASYDVVVTHRPDGTGLAAITPGDDLQVESSASWVSEMSVAELTGGDGSSGVPVVVGAPVLLGVALAAATVAMSHTRRSRDRAVLRGAGASSAQLLVIDQLHALVPVLLGLAVAGVASLAIVSTVGAGLVGLVGAPFSVPLPWTTLGTVALAFLLPTIGLTAVQSAISGRRLA